MKVTIIQSDSRLVITTNKNVAKVSKDFMLMHDEVVVTQESSIVHDFCIKSCQLLNPVGKILVAETVIAIGESMDMACECRINYVDECVSICEPLLSFGEISVRKNHEVESILMPLIQNHIESNFKPQIHEFYTDGSK